MGRKAVGRVLKLLVKAKRGPRKGTEYVRHFKTQRGYEKALQAGARTLESRAAAVTKKAARKVRVPKKKLAKAPSVIRRPFARFERMGLKPGTKKWMKHWQANPDKQAAMTAYAKKLRESAR